VNGILFLVRFFHVVSPLSGLVVWTFGALVSAAACLVIVAPERTAGALAPLLLLQMFAASSGFALPARRGHYDVLLTGTGRRTSIALAHWLTSIAPGIASWLIVASVESLTSGSAAAALASGTCVAMLLVSTIPWAITIALPRFSGGIGWLLVLTIARVTFSSERSAWLNVHGAQERPMSAAWSVLVYPISAVGRHLSSDDALIVLPALGLATMTMVGACVWVQRESFPLEAAQ
jgi:hypothetical protein